MKNLFAIACSIYVLTIFSSCNFNNFKTSEAEKEFSEPEKGEWNSKPDPLTPEQKIAIWNDLANYPTDAGQRTNNSWVYEGPNFLQVNANLVYTGRIRSLEYYPSANASIGLTIGSASGGIWGVNSFGNDIYSSYAFSRQGNLNTPNIGYVARHPILENTFLAGTGEPVQTGGTGIWKTIDGGMNWTPTTFTNSPIPYEFSKIIYGAFNYDIVHTASVYGYYLSEDKGVTWTRRLTGNVTDIARHPLSDDTLLACVSGVGIYKSVNGGYGWALIPNAPSAGMIGECKLSWSNSSPRIVYAISTKGSAPSETDGIYKSVDGGDTWVKCFWGDGAGGSYFDFHYGQGAYNNCIAVNPANPNIVVVGGGAHLVTLDGFNFFTQPGSTHADYHALVWNEDGTKLFAGNDGGLFVSTDYGTTWSSQYNVLPITQFNSLDIAKNNNDLILGGTQDNATAARVNLGAGVFWKYVNGGDVWNAAFNENNPSESCASVGASLYTTTDGWQTENPIGNLPLGAIGNFSKIGKFERSNTVNWPNINALYVKGKNNLYWRDIFGNWTASKPVDFANDLYAFDVSNRPLASDNSNLYVALSPPSTSKIWKRDRTDGVYKDISNGIPVDAVNAYNLHAHPTNFDEVYAFSSTSNVQGQKIFKTLDAGNTPWVDVTGDFPQAVPVNVFAVSPVNSDILLVGSSSFGMFRSDNGGANWYIWNNALPKGEVITGIDFMDSTSINGKLYAVISTYGRGIWKREMSGTDPSAIIQLPNEEKGFEIKSVSLGSNKKIEFEIISSTNDAFSIGIYNLSGQLVATRKENITANQKHTTVVEGGSFASGVYLVNCANSNGISRSAKVVLKNL